MDRLAENITCNIQTFAVMTHLADSLSELYFSTRKVMLVFPLVTCTRTSYMCSEIFVFLLLFLNVYLDQQRARVCPQTS